MAEHNKIYKKADYYDIVFDRNVSKEVAFLLNVYQKFYGNSARATLDLACGPGYHALEVARLGLRSTGLDLNTEMIQLGQEKASRESLCIEWLVQDLRSFKLDQPADIAFIIFDGLDALSKIPY